MYKAYKGHKTCKVTKGDPITQTKTLPNVNVIGSLSNENCVLSGFSTNGYAIVPTTIYYKMSGGPSYLQFNFKATTQNITTLQYLFAPATGQYGFLFGIKSSKTILYLSSNGTSWNRVNGKVGVITLIEGQTYYFRVTLGRRLAQTQQYVKVEISTDNTNWEVDLDITFTDATDEEEVEFNVVLGMRSSSYWQGAIDLKETAIYGSREWKWEGTTTKEVTYNTYKLIQEKQ